MRMHRMVALALALPLAAACGPNEAEIEAGMPAPDMSLTVASVAGTYALVAYGEDEVPVAVDRDDVQNCREEITSGTLGLMEEGRFTFTFMEREVCPDEIETESHTITGEWELRDGMLHFNEEDDGRGEPGTLDLADFEHGHFEGGLLKISPEAVQGPLYTVFRRQ